MHVARSCGAGGAPPGERSAGRFGLARTFRRAAVLAGALALAVLSAGLVACAPGDESTSADARERETGFRGVALPDDPRMPDLVLHDTEGASFDLRARTRGSVTLLFFGYTHCPDVCPVQMTNLAAVLEELRPSERSRIQVVFVTTDPERDTPERLRRWLDRRDATFVGLRGPVEKVNEAQRKLGLPVSAPQGPDEAADGYAVGHASQVLAFTPDGRARLAYPFGTRQTDWAHDLPILVDERRAEDG
ncbi:MAG: SCO family protein [Gemmatimonadota bacterium]